jgi:hypothetical protein
MLELDKERRYPEKKPKCFRKTPEVAALTLAAGNHR